METNHCNRGNKSFIEDLQKVAWQHTGWNYQVGPGRRAVEGVSVGLAVDN